VSIAPLQQHFDAFVSDYPPKPFCFRAVHVFMWRHILKVCKHDILWVDLFACVFVFMLCVFVLYCIVVLL